MCITLKCAHTSWISGKEYYRVFKIIVVKSMMRIIRLDTCGRVSLGGMLAGHPTPPPLPLIGCCRVANLVFLSLYLARFKAKFTRKAKQITINCAKRTAKKVLGHSNKFNVFLMTFEVNLATSNHSTWQHWAAGRFKGTVRLIPLWK